MKEKEHLLTILMEECNETSQRASKAIRFGLKEIQQDQSLNNSQRLIYEFNDIIAIMEILQEKGYLSEEMESDNPINREMIDEKKEKVKKYIDYSKKCKTIEED